jgi:hypothetical protein
VQVVRLLGRPALEAGRVARHGGEVAVVQPVEHGLFLGHAGVALLLLQAVAMLAQGERGAVLGRLGVEAFGPAGADEEEVADLDVAALGCRADVYALGLAAGGEFGVGDAVGV